MIIFSAERQDFSLYFMKKYSAFWKGGMTEKSLRGYTYNPESERIRTLRCIS